MAIFTPQTLQTPARATEDSGAMGSGSMTNMPHSMAIVSLDQVTHRAVASGDWSNPATWENGIVPTQWAKVHIPAEITVRVDGEIAESMKTVRVDGTLDFATDRDTELKVDTLVTMAQSKLIVGTQQTPIASDVTAKITIANDGEIDREWDPGLLSRGLLIHGETSMYGAEKSAFHTLATQPAAGATEITLSEVPTGWAVGDSLVIAGTDPNDPTSDEQVTITSINGTTIGFDTPLTLDHIAPSPDLDVHVANLSRNIEISSENEGALNRGHAMFMHTNDADLNYVSFSKMGRTDKSQPLNDWVLVSESEGSIGPEHTEVEDLGGSNVRGRYSLHFHRGGVDKDGDPALVNGVVVESDPGWGFVNHSSNVVFSNNVAYDITGSAYNTEAGNEIGAFRGNIALRTVNPDARPNPTENEIDEEQEPDARVQNMDFGWQGEGFWLHGAGVELQDNVVSGASGHGYIYWTLGLVEKGMGENMVDVANLPNGDLIGPDGTMVRTKQVPVPLFDNNDAYSAAKGLQIHYLHTDHRDDGDREFEEEGLLAVVPQEYEDQLLSTFSNSTYWNVSTSAVDAPYTGRVAFDNITALGDGSAGSVGVRLDHFASENGLSLTNSDVQGFEIGVNAPRAGIETLSNLTLANIVDLTVSQPVDALDQDILDTFTFAELPPFLAGEDRQTIVQREDEFEEEEDEEDLDENEEDENDEDENEEEENDEDETEEPDEPEEEEENDDEPEEDDEDAEDDFEDFFTIIEGTESAERLPGSRDDDAIFGGAGNDKLIGKKGDDVLFGEEGSDRLKGGPGDDHLDGGEGRDFYVGGPGEDVFVLGADRVDVVVDYTPEADLLDVSDWGVESLGELSVEQAGKKWVIFVTDDPELSAWIKTKGVRLDEEDWSSDVFIFSDDIA